MRTERLGQRGPWLFLMVGGPWHGQWKKVERSLFSDFRDVNIIDPIKVEFVSADERFRADNFTVYTLQRCFSGQAYLDVLVAWRDIAAYFKDGEPLLNDALHAAIGW